MNESLAKQLHDLIKHAKFNLKSDIDVELNDIESHVEKLIEDNETTQNQDRAL